MANELRIHIISPLISQGFRDDASLRAVFERHCRITSGCLDNGPASMESAVDEVLAALGVVDAAIRAEWDGADAVVIDCMLDPGLEAAREAASIPVIGAGEAGFATAAELGRFSVVTVLDRQAPMFRDLARRHGLSDRLASARGIGVRVLALEQDRAASIDKTIPVCAAALADDGAFNMLSQLERGELDIAVYIEGEALSLKRQGAPVDIWLWDSRPILTQTKTISRYSDPMQKRLAFALMNRTLSPEFLNAFGDEFMWWPTNSEASITAALADEGVENTADAVNGFWVPDWEFFVANKMEITDRFLTIGTGRSIF